jgi:hypothetical protein
VSRFVAPLRFVPLLLSACTFEIRPLTVDSDLGAATAADLASAPSDFASAPDLATPDLVLVPTLAGEHDDIPQTVDLTAEGTIDWAHFGLNAATDVNRKSGGPQSIALVVTGAATQWPTYARTFTWTDGAPTASATTTAGIYVRSPLGDGYQLTIPCDGASHTLRVYATNYYSTGRLTAHLDGATDYTDDETTDNNTHYRYTLAFRGPVGTMLQVSWKMTVDRGGSVDLFGATLY